MAGALAAGLLTAACSSTTSGQGSAAAGSGAPTGFPSSSGGPSSAAPSSGGASSHASAASGGQLTRSTLSRALLRADDLPSGWTSKKPDSGTSSADSASNRRLAICLGDPSLADDHHLLDINGANFTKGTTQLSSEAESYPSAAVVARQVAAVKNPRFEGCLRKELRTAIASGLPSGTHVGTVVLKLVKPTTGFSSNLLAIASGVVVVRNASGATIPVFVLDAFITGRRLTTSVEAFSDGTPLDSLLVGSAVRAVSTRARSI